MNEVPETIWVSQWYSGAFGTKALNAYASDESSSLHRTKYRRADLVNAEIERLKDKITELEIERELSGTK